MGLRVVGGNDGLLCVAPTNNHVAPKNLRPHVHDHKYIPNDFGAFFAAKSARRTRLGLVQVHIYIYMCVMCLLLFTGALLLNPPKKHPLIDGPCSFVYMCSP